MVENDTWLKMPRGFGKHDIFVSSGYVFDTDEKSGLFSRYGDTKVPYPIISYANGGRRIFIFELRTQK